MPSATHRRGRRSGRPRPPTIRRRLRGPRFILSDLGPVPVRADDWRPSLSLSETVAATALSSPWWSPAALVGLARMFDDIDSGRLTLAQVIAQVEGGGHAAS